MNFLIFVNRSPDPNVTIALQGGPKPTAFFYFAASYEAVFILSKRNLQFIQGPLRTLTVRNELLIKFFPVAAVH